MQKWGKSLVLRASKSIGLFWLARRLSRGSVRILCYHGGCLGDEKNFNPLLFCDAEHLTRRMSWLKENGFSFVSLDTAVGSLHRHDQGTADRIVVTFDDGWRSTASELLPVLQALDIPSTLYLCTAQYLETWPVIPVVVNYCVWKTPRACVTLHDLSDEFDGEYDLRQPREKFRFIDAAEKHLRKQCSQAESADEALRCIERFATAIGIRPDELNLRSGRFNYLTREVLATLALQSCAVELHGHEHQYPMGKPLEFRQDLECCASFIMDAGLPKPRHYCYPSGSFDASASAILREMNIVSATTCEPGLVSRIDDESVYFFPRFLDGGQITQLEFEAEMTGFLSGVRWLRTRLKHLKWPSAEPERRYAE